ncbi:EamA family transporter [Streptosporangium sp. NPDC087985]|uniref:EamA family transporter n=1 Tax=Streptosporangium sp. NPDC087985 TaxID=3366196 RepID=UPI00380B0B5D
MTSLYTGIALSVPLLTLIGAAGTAWLRNSFAALIFLAIARPRLRGRPARDLATAGALGVVSSATAVFVFESVARIPLATEVAISLLGPLALAVARRSGRYGLAWPLLALTGVLLLTQPWRGMIDGLGVLFAIGAAVTWAVYILLTQRIGDRFRGLEGLAVSVPASAIALTFVGAPQAAGNLSWDVLLTCAGLAVLVPVLPYALELLALRRLTTAAFGTLMSLEPAVALVIGVIFLGQAAGPVQVTAIALVTLAAIGAARDGGR